MFYNLYLIAKLRLQLKLQLLPVRWFFFRKKVIHFILLKLA